MGGAPTVAEPDVRAAVSARRVRGRQPGGQTGHSAPGQAERGGRPTAARGRVRLALIRDLAMGEWSHADIAKELGCTAKEVREFAADNTAEIAEVSAALAGRLALETAGLWISKKQNRVAELMSLYEDGDELMGYLRGLGVDDAKGLGSRRHTQLVRSQLAIMAQVAAEYQPQRGAPLGTGSDGESNVLHIVLEGPETEELS